MLNDFALINKYLDHVQSPTKIQLIKQAFDILMQSKDEASKASSIKTAVILAKINCDATTIASGLLCKITFKPDIKIIQNQEVNELLHGVSIINRFTIINNKSKQNLTNHFIKAIVTMVNDPRVLLIQMCKLYADIKYANYDSSIQSTIANNIMHIYAPLANRLGIGVLKRKLEDIAFKTLQPQQYDLINKHLIDSELQQQQIIDDIKQKISKLLTHNNINGFTITGRTKHKYSIYKKTIAKKTTVQNIHDAIAMRVKVKTLEECYTVLGILQQAWSDLIEEFDDYIIHPKQNGYQSLHIILLDQDYKFEVQIRTYDMHINAEVGIAAHWIYKSQNKVENIQQIKGMTLQNILNWQESFKQKFFSLKNIAENNIFVFSPHGDIVCLPTNSTPIDFAYYIHTEVGHQCSGAKVNGKIVPLSYKLATGDCVVILTDKKHTPSRDWLNPNKEYIQSKKARSKIANWFHEDNEQQVISKGKEILQEQLRQFDSKEVDINALLISTNYKNINQLYYGIAKNEIKLASHLPKKTYQTKHQKEYHHPKFFGEVMVSELGKIDYRIAKCCNPLDPNKIIGYITSNRGTIIHRFDCAEIFNNRDLSLSRLMQVQWRNNTDFQFIYFLTIEHNDIEAINSIHRTLNKYNITTSTINTKNLNNNNYSTRLLVLTYHNHIQWHKIMNTLQYSLNTLKITSNY